MLKHTQASLAATRTVLLGVAYEVFNLENGLPATDTAKFAVGDASGTKHLCLLLPWKVTKAMLDKVFNNLMKSWDFESPIIISVNGGITDTGMKELIKWILQTGVKVKSLWATHHKMTCMMHFANLFRSDNWQEYGHLHLSHGNMHPCSVMEFLDGLKVWISKKPFTIIRLDSNPNVAMELFKHQKYLLEFMLLFTLDKVLSAHRENTIQVGAITGKSTDTTYQQAHLDFNQVQTPRVSLGEFFVVKQPQHLRKKDRKTSLLQADSIAPCKADSIAPCKADSIAPCKADSIAPCKADSIAPEATPSTWAERLVASK
jgi:hypothetical protein